MNKITVVTLFKDVFEAYFRTSMMAKADQKKLIQFEIVDLRQFGLGNHRKVDDLPYGGGDGMILMVEPLVAAIESIRARAERETKVILLTPRGQLFSQSQARQLARLNQQFDFILIGGRYEGYDERIIHWADFQISIGNYVLTGFELPALVVIDSLVRLVPGVLGGASSASLDSFSEDSRTKEHPHYTRPAKFRDLEVPAVLLEGNHQAIEDWRNRNRQTD